MRDSSLKASMSSSVVSLAMVLAPYLYVVPALVAPARCAW